MQARGSEIRRKREASGYNQADFARLVDLSPSWLSRIENGQANPSPDALRRIALAFKRERGTRAAIAEIARHESEGSRERSPDG